MLLGVFDCDEEAVFSPVNDGTSFISVMMMIKYLLPKNKTT